MKTIYLRGLEIGAGAPKIIVPIVERTEEGIIEKAKEFRKHNLDVVEWRSDFFNDVFDIPKVLVVLKALRSILVETPILFTFRTQKEGGEKR